MAKTLPPPRGAALKIPVVPPGTANLRRLAQTLIGSMTLWSYVDLDTSQETMKQPGFFVDAHNIIKPGDHILVSACDGGAHLWVANVSREKVTTAQMCGVYMLPDGRRRGE